MEDPSQIAPENLYQMTQSPSKGPAHSTKIDIAFEKGMPIRVTELSSGRIFEQPYDILTFLNKVGGEHGVGRIDIVENRFIGMKVSVKRLSIKFKIIQ